MAALGYFICQQLRDENFYLPKMAHCYIKINDFKAYIKEKDCSFKLATIDGYVYF